MRKFAGVVAIRRGGTTQSERVELETHALAQWEMARSTMVEMAPSRPPNTDESELELELEDDDERSRCG